MNIVIDTSTLSKVFNKGDQMHKEFSPVLDFIIQGEGVVCFGGSKYIKELSKAERYLRIFNLLKDVGKAKAGDRLQIDSQEQKLMLVKELKEFNDHHLLAIASCMKCRVICTFDAEASQLLCNKAHGPKGKNKIVLYTNSGNKSLLSKKYLHKGEAGNEKKQLNKKDQTDVISKIQRLL